jgi:predicted MFS family arabinose efflux permease
MSSSDRARRNVRLLLTARGVRAFGDGFVSILVPVYLTGIGFGTFGVGVLTTAMLLGPAMMTLVIGLIAHRLKAVRLLTTATTLMVVSGLGYAFETEFWPLLLIALVGTLSPTASDVSAFAPLEQTLLSNAVVPQRRTSIFATYSLIGSVLSAVGCLFASAPEIVARAGPIPPNRALQGMFLLYAFLGAITFMIYRQLKSPVEATVSEPAIGPLGPSRRIVFTLAALFSLDSFGGGFFVQSLLALWLFDHFGLSLTAAGSLFFWSGLLSALSYPAAVRLARRIGLVNTMVFTHLPSNVCLMLVPFASTLGIAIALLLIRSTLSQMDVPARTSYVMAVVTPPERPAAASVTAAPRSIAGAASPVLAGYLLGLSGFGWPLVIGGGLNSLYDLLLLFMFRKVRPPEEQVLEDVHGDVASSYHVVDPSVTPTRS